MRLHFAPGLRLRRTSSAWLVENADGRSLACLVSNGLDWRETSSPYHPEFGREELRPCLTTEAAFRDTFAAKSWLLLK
jgi:hypothetical protein